MYLYQINYLHRAVQSLITCTAPSVQRGAVIACADHLCSPYGGRHTVTYHVSAQAAILAAWNGRHKLWVGDEPPAPEALGGLVHDWVQVEAASVLLWPLLDLTERLGLGRLELPGVVSLYIAMPRLAGFHYGKPVFFAANAANTVVSVTGGPEYQQGHLLIFDNDCDLSLPLWYDREYFFNHVLNEKSTAKPVYATPNAVLVGDVPHAAVWVANPGRVFSPDHDDLEIPVGRWIALHPFPKRSVD